MSGVELGGVVAAAQAGDEGAFTELVQRYRRELQVHCYRMLGSVVESEDLVCREWILHVDLDQFIAAVEVLRRPELRGRPVVVGGSGDPTRARQVVATASYEARTYGIGSGMPIRAAARRCPDAVFLPTDPAAYDAASAQVMGTLRAFPVVVEVMGNKPVEAIWGIGAKTSQRLAAAGIATVVELAAADPVDLALRFGPTIGPHLRQLGLGGDSRPVVDEPWVARSRSRETTFEHDLTERPAMAEQVTRMAEALTTEVVADGRLVVRVAVKVRYGSFFTRTKISKLPAPATDPHVVADAAVAVLKRFDLTRPVRLLGVRVELDPPAVR